MNCLYRCFSYLEKLFSRFSFYGIAYFSILARGPHLDAPITSENISRSSRIDVNTYNCVQLIWMPLLFSRTFSVDSRFIMVFFRMVHNQKQKVQRYVSDFLKWSIPPMYLEKIKSRRKLFKTCSIHGKNLQISSPYNFRTPVKKKYSWWLKLKLLDLVWFGSWFGGPWPPSSPQWLRPCWLRFLSYS